MAEIIAKQNLSSCEGNRGGWWNMEEKDSGGALWCQTYLRWAAYPCVVEPGEAWTVWWCPLQAAGALLGSAVGCSPAAASGRTAGRNKSDVSWRRVDAEKERTDGEDAARYEQVKRSDDKRKWELKKKSIRQKSNRRRKVRNTKNTKKRRERGWWEQRRGGRRVLSANWKGVIRGELTVGKSARCRVPGDPKSLVNLARWRRKGRRLWRTEEAAGVGAMYQQCFFRSKIIKI